MQSHFIVAKWMLKEVKHLSKVTELLIGNKVTYNWVTIPLHMKIIKERSKYYRILISKEGQKPTVIISNFINAFLQFRIYISYCFGFKHWFSHIWFLCFPKMSYSKSFESLWLQVINIFWFFLTKSSVPSRLAFLKRIHKPTKEFCFK